MGKGGKEMGKPYYFFAHHRYIATIRTAVNGWPNPNFIDLTTTSIAGPRYPSPSRNRNDKHKRRGPTIVGQRQSRRRQLGFKRQLLQTPQETSINMFFYNLNHLGVKENKHLFFVLQRKTNISIHIYRYVLSFFFWDRSIDSSSMRESWGICMLIRTIKYCLLARLE
jgi:hypothetical protein